MRALASADLIFLFVAAVTLAGIGIDYSVRSRDSGTDETISLLAPLGPAPCHRGHWGPWQPCQRSQNGCRRTRHRQAVRSWWNFGSNQINLCQPTVHTQACDCDTAKNTGLERHCVVGEWSEWSQCTQTCGLGMQSRWRPVTTYADDCPLLHEARACTLPPCPLLTCDTMDRIQLEDSYFAKGYSKMVWAGRFAGMPVVVKRPIENSEGALMRFNRGVSAEIRWLQQFANESFIMRYHGQCEDEAHRQTVVEGGLVKWEHVRESCISDCARLHLAQQVIEALQHFRDAKFFHCDWKFDQTAVNMTGAFKIVDLKSLYPYPETGPYKSDLACSEHEKCKRCLKMMDLPEDQACDIEQGHCRGYDSSSQLVATVRSFFNDLLEESTLSRPLTEALSRASSQQRAARPPLDEVWQSLEVEQARLGCPEQRLPWSKHDQTCLQQAYTSMMATSRERCQKRYC